MRRAFLTTLLVSAIGLSMADSMAAYGEGPSCFGRGSAASCDGSAIVVERSGSSRGTRTSGGGSSGPADLVFPSVTQQSDGSQCIQASAAPGARELFGDKAQEAQARAWQTQSQKFPMCPGQAAAQVDPVVFAITFWREVKLPEPKPYVAPGWAITGKYAYLETRGDRRKTYTSETPFGPLELVASGRYSVDWGDGTRTGPFDFEGQPWPDGRITHTYINVGTYTIRVREDWSATWRIGGANGSLSGLRTDANIDNFRVEQIQVVIGAGA